MIRSVSFVLSYILSNYNVDVIIVGDEKTGVDRAVALLCKRLNVPCIIVRRRCNAPWCLVERTRKVVEMCDVLHALFPRQPYCSKGTTIAVKHALRLKKPVVVWVCNEECNPPCRQVTIV